jgi:hypothetical protein
LPSTIARALRRSPGRPRAGRAASGAGRRALPKHELTIRHGPRVSREAYDELDAAIRALERHVEQIRSEGPLREVSAIRTYGPERRVHARLELSTGGFLRGREAGVDVMGDGALVPYVGVVRKRKLEPVSGESAFDVIRRELG